jgi:hypothetical protein
MENILFFGIAFVLMVVGVIASFYAYDDRKLGTDELKMERKRATAEMSIINMEERGD